MKNTGKWPRNWVDKGAYPSFDVSNSFHFGALHSAESVEYFSAPFWHRIRIRNTQSLNHSHTHTLTHIRIHLQWGESPFTGLIEICNESQADPHATCTAALLCKCCDSRCALAACQRHRFISYAKSGSQNSHTYPLPLACPSYPSHLGNIEAFAVRLLC